VLVFHKETTLKTKMALGLAALIAANANPTLARSPDMDKQLDQAAANVRKELPKVIKTDNHPHSLTWFDVRRVDDKFVLMYRVTNATLNESPEFKRSLIQNLRPTICSTPEGKQIKAWGYRPGFIIYREDSRKFIEDVCP
jgi:hypothetical protein